jgi:hypothetical protein
MMDKPKIFWITASGDSMGDQQNPLLPRERIIGAAFVAMAIFISYKVMGPASIILNLGLIVSYLIWATAIWLNDPPPIFSLYLLGIAIQGLHFYEEYLTGFQKKFPAFFGYEWSDRRFVVFNLVWLSLFVLSAFGLLLKSRLAYLPAFFFALVGEIGNGIAHLALSVAQRRYFPGLFTAPVVLVVGLVLLSRLMKTTEAQPKQPTVKVQQT